MQGESAFRESLRGFSAPPQGSGGIGSTITNFFQRTTETGSESLQGLLGGARDTANTGLASLGLGTRPREDNDADFWGLTYFQRFIVFGACTLGGIFCMVISFFTLPLVVLTPQKFAATFTLGSVMLMSSFAILRGPVTHFKNICSKERLPFTLAYFGSLIGTLYFSMFARSYILSIIFIVIQIIALVWYFFGNFPTGARSMFSAFGFMGRSMLPT